MTPRLPLQLEKLLDTELDTHDKVEVVWHLASEPRPIDIAELGIRVQLGRAVLSETLDELAASCFVVVEVVDGVALASLGRRARRSDVQELVRARTNDPIGVMSALTALSIRRIRSMAARTFAEAFMFHPRTVLAGGDNRASRGAPAGDAGDGEPRASAVALRLVPLKVSR